jgi:hypothetical protein
LLQNRNDCCKISLKTTERRKNRLAKEFADYILYGVDVFTTYVKEWYTGNLQELFFHQPENPDVKEKSVRQDMSGTRQSFCEMSGLKENS